MTDLRDDVRAVGCGWTTADAEDEPGGFDDGGVEIGGVQGYQLEDALGGWEGRLQFAVIAAVREENEELAWTSSKWDRKGVGIPYEYMVER